MRFYRKNTKDTRKNLSNHNIYFMPKRLQQFFWVCLISEIDNCLFDFHIGFSAIERYTHADGPPRQVAAGSTLRRCSG